MSQSSPKKCVQCQQTKALKEFFPFCSKRCRLIDLGAWAAEEYRIAAREEEEEDPQGVVSEDREQ